MNFIADFHVHSHYSRATSKNLDPEHFSLWAQKKGIALVGTGDFTHPGWLSELKEKMREAEEGLYSLTPALQKRVDSMVPSNCLSKVRFMLSGEISCIYKKNGATRKLHHLILMPDMESVARLNERLARIGNITSDGRPILGLDSRDLLEITLEASDKAFFIPAHIWTPWFSLFGSKSGFDSLEECFEDLYGHIYALETGLSSDPPMNRLISALDGYVLVSNSDAHSPSKLGREANLFSTELKYPHIINAMKGGKGFSGTVEFYPEEGKYHLDGHRKCQVRLKPHETRDAAGVCPACGRPVTIGVLHRVHELSDRETPDISMPFFSLIPLTEILSEILSCGPSSKKVTSEYERLLAALGPELKILMDVEPTRIEEEGGPLLSEAVKRMRRGQVTRREGYDGEYGVIRLFDPSEIESLAGQTSFLPRTRQALLPPDDEKHSIKNARQGKKRDKVEKSSSHDPILDPLNREQKAAVQQEKGNLLVVAGPGTGKTMTLTHRIAYLVRAKIARPEQMVAMTFTRKAVNEMKQRIASLLPGNKKGDSRADDRNASVLITTFHGFCLQILRDYPGPASLPPQFTICQESDASALSEICAGQYGGGKRLLRTFMNMLPRLKEGTLHEGEGADVDQGILQIFKCYQQKLRENQILDLEDVQIEALRLLRNFPDVACRIGQRFPWIFVDEYQDTNSIQTELLKALHLSCSKVNERENPCIIFAIGDPDQAIYGFRGADVRNFENFVKDFPGAIKIALKKNYRSSRPILQCAADFMGKTEALESNVAWNEPVFTSSCSTDAEEAEMIVEQIEGIMGGTSHFSIDSGRVDSFCDGLSIGFGDIAVLFRLNAQGHILAEALTRAGIPFVRSGEAPLISRYPVDTIWRFFQVIDKPDSRFYLDRYTAHLEERNIKPFTNPASFDPEGNIEDLVERALLLHGLDCGDDDSQEAIVRLKQVAREHGNEMAPFLDTISLDRGIDHSLFKGDRVALMSLHAAKGLEWQVVFITGCENGLMPCSLFGEADRHEERRLFYVGMTRARKRLILSHSSRRRLNGRRLNMKASEFLGLIAEKHLKPLERRGFKARKKQKQLELF